MNNAAPTNRNPEMGRNKSNLLHKLVESSSLQCTTPVRSYLLQSSCLHTFLICHIFLSAGVKGNVQGNLFKIITKNDIHYYIQASSKAERTQWIEAIKPLTWVRWTQWQRKSHTCDLVSCSLRLAFLFFVFFLLWHFIFVICISITPSKFLTDQNCRCLGVTQIWNNSPPGIYCLTKRQRTTGGYRQMMFYKETMRYTIPRWKKKESLVQVFSLYLTDPGCALF